MGIKKDSQWKVYKIEHDVVFLRNQDSNHGSTSLMRTDPVWQSFAHFRLVMKGDSMVGVAKANIGSDSDSLVDSDVSEFSESSESDREDDGALLNQPKNRRRLPHRYPGWKPSHDIPRRRY